MDEKICSKCKKNLPLKYFHRDKRLKSGYRSYCKDCARDHKLQYHYGLTSEMYNNLLKMQNNVCAICGRKPGKKKLSVDHDHSCCPGRISCGKCIRGLLCRQCNYNLLGLICKEDKDKVYALEVLNRAIKYLTPEDDTIVM